MKSYVDSTGQVARITTFMRDTGNMGENTLWTKINKIFPDRYEVIMTGKALVLKRNEILLDNLLTSLLLRSF
jgi:hypothetical protein